MNRKRRVYQSHSRRLKYRLFDRIFREIAKKTAALFEELAIEGSHAFNRRRNLRVRDNKVGPVGGTDEYWDSARLQR